MITFQYLLKLKGQEVDELNVIIKKQSQMLPICSGLRTEKLARQMKMRGAHPVRRLRQGTFNSEPFQLILR
jgi:hypothetical protein